jgi:1,3-beta-glucanosyltransferase GAS5
MSEVSSKETTLPDIEPVYTKDNYFWRGKERFFIKGISYLPRKPGDIFDEFDKYQYSLADPLSDEYIPQLHRDIKILKELGLNTIQVSGIDPTKNHQKAMAILAKAGIYVIIDICEKMKSPKFHGPAFDPAFDPSPFYTLYLMRRTLRIVDQLADCPNLLGFSVSAHTIRFHALTKMAEVCRAVVRDTKAFLRLRGGRCPPVGVHINDIAMQRLPMLQYFAAGSKDERIDYFAMECYSWASPSSFYISGWSHLVRALEPYPVPMLLAEFGTNVNRRDWSELECLHSPDMTGVFSGGCMYTYFEYGNSYGIVNINDDGEVEKKAECDDLKRRLEVVNSRELEEIWTAPPRSYEDWSGNFPPVGRDWNATSAIPNLPASMAELHQEIRSDER